MEESALNTGQRQYANYAVMEDVPTSLKGGESARDMTQMLKDAPMDLTGDVIINHLKKG